MNARDLFVASLFVIFCRPAWANADVCPDYIEPEITTTPVFEEVGYSHDLGMTALEAQRNQTVSDHTEKVSTGRTEIPVGLMTNAVEMAFHSEMRLSSSRSGTLCAQITKINFKMTIKDPTVFIASEIPEGSCGYDVVMKHELRHVLVSKQFLNDAISVVTPHIQTFLDQEGVIRTTTDRKAEVESHFNEALHEYLGPLNANLLAVLQKRQKEEVDTPEEYARVGTVCDGAIARIVSQTLHRN